MGASISGGITCGVDFGARISGSSPQTCVDVVGQPAITVVDFFGQTGASYVTGGPGKYFTLFDQVENPYSPWFSTGTETDPNGGGPVNDTQVNITAVSQPSDIASALASAWNSALPSVATATVINGGGTNSAVQFTMAADANYMPIVDGTSPLNTGAAFSQTQPGYPSGHYCTPTSDALAGISNIKSRFQTTYGGVGYNASLGGAPAFTTQDLSGNQLLFQDAAMTIPAVASGDIVEAIFDPTTGKTLIQSNSMNAGVLEFKQNSNGVWCPVVSFTSSGTGMLSNVSVTMPFIISVASIQTTSSAFGGSRVVCSTTINGIISPTRKDDSWFLNGNVFDGVGTPAIGLNIWNVSSISAISGQNAKAWLNGANITNGTTSSQDFGTLGVGAVSSAAEAPFALIGSVIAYDPSNQSTVEEYMELFIP